MLLLHGRWHELAHSFRTIPLADQVDQTSRFDRPSGPDEPGRPYSEPRIDSMKSRPPARPALRDDDSTSAPAFRNSPDSFDFRLTSQASTRILIHRMVSLSRNDPRAIFTQRSARTRSRMVCTSSIPGRNARRPRDARSNPVYSRIAASRSPIAPRAVYALSSALTSEI